MAKKTVSVTLYMSEILFDLQNETYLTGRSMQADGNVEAVASMQANEDDEDMNKLLRSVQNAFGTLRTKLSEYLVEDGTSATNALISKNSNIDISLQMPSNYNLATKETVAASCSKYITFSALAEWFKVTKKDEAADYIALANAAITELREALSKRVRPTRTDPVDPASGSGSDSGSDA